jgi:hypothetical protein
MTGIHRQRSQESLPSGDRADDRMQGHWLLARLGKRMLRPGGAELTRELLARTFRTHRERLAAVAIIAHKPGAAVG